MMEPADLCKRHDLSGSAGLYRSPIGGVLAQRKMRSGSVVIIEVRNKDPSQMSFMQDDHVVQAFAPHAADQAFHIRILPRASRRRDDLFHTPRHYGRAQRLPVCAVPVADQILRRRGPREGFAYPLRHPIRGRMCSDAEMLDAPPLMMIVCMLQTVAGSGLKCHDFCRRRDFEERQPGPRIRITTSAARSVCPDAYHFLS